MLNARVPWLRERGRDYSRNGYGWNWLRVCTVVSAKELLSGTKRQIRCSEDVSCGHGDEHEHNWNKHSNAFEFPTGVEVKHLNEREG